MNDADALMAEPIKTAKCAPKRPNVALPPRSAASHSRRPISPAHGGGPKSVLRTIPAPPRDTCKNVALGGPFPARIFNATARTTSKHHGARSSRPLYVSYAGSNSGMNEWHPEKRCGTAHVLPCLILDPFRRHAGRSRAGWVRPVCVFSHGRFCSQ